MKKPELALLFVTTGLAIILMEDKVRQLRQNNSEIVKEVESYLRYNRLAVLVNAEDMASIERLEKSWTNNNYRWQNRDIIPKVISRP